MENIPGFLVAKQTHKYGLLNTKDSFEFFQLFNGGDGCLSYYSRIKNASKILYDDGCSIVDLS